MPPGWADKRTSASRNSATASRGFGTVRRHQPDAATAAVTKPAAEESQRDGS